MNEQRLRRKIASNYDRPDPYQAFLMDYRDLVIAIGDDQVEGDPVRLCRVLAAGEIRWARGEPAKTEAE